MDIRGIAGIALSALVAVTAPAAPAAAALEAPTDQFTGIRPGVLMVAPSTCTIGFVFQTTGSTFDPSQQLYLGAAEHCVDFVGQAVSVRAPNPATGLVTEIVVGQVDYMSPTNDVAFVKVDMAWNSWVSPTLAHWGGPVGVDTTATVGTPVTCTGHPRGGLNIARTGVVYSRTPDYVIWSCPTVGGDSGGPVTTADGLALAAVHQLEIVRNTDPKAGAGGGGPSIQSMLAQGGHPLATCASRTPWPLPGCPPL